MYIKHHLIGKKFGLLTVERLLTKEENKSKTRKWFCKCECGNTSVVRQDCLLSGNTKSCGCLSILALKIGQIKGKNLEGQKFGRLLVSHKIGKNERGDFIWLCICDCGNNVAVKSGHLTSSVGGVKSCGCLLTDFHKSRQLAFGEASFNQLYRSYITAAKSRGYEFALSKTCFRELTSNTCHYCGAKPNTIISGKSYFGYYVFNGIDRINNKDGYHESNCVTCCKTCNFMKRDMNYDEFINKGSFIAKKHVNKFTPRGNSIGNCS